MVTSLLLNDLSSLCAFYFLNFGVSMSLLNRTFSKISVVGGIGEISARHGSKIDIAIFISVGKSDLKSHYPSALEPTADKPKVQ